MTTATLLIVPALAVFASAQDLRKLETVPARAILEATRDALPFLAWSDVLYGRELHVTAPPNVKRAYDSAWRPIRYPPRGGFEQKELIRLLRDRDPRIRTLAAIVLFDSGDRRMLPHIATLLGDTAQTFPSASPVSSSATPHLFGGNDPWKGWRPNVRPDTVGAATTRMLAFHAGRVQQHPVDAETWDKYWGPRKARKWCTSWFDSRLNRITGGTFPMPPLSLIGPGTFLTLRTEIQALPQPDRDWVQLAVFSTWEGSRVVTSDDRLASELWYVPERDLLFAAKRRGREELLRMLRGSTPTDDPDMPHYREGIVRFVLQHSAELLLPADADELVRLGKNDKSGWNAIWFLAAARAAPTRSGKLIRSLLPSVPKLMFLQRQKMVSALWELAGREHTDFVVEWFYGDEHIVLGSAPPRAVFLAGVAQRYGAADRALLKRLIEDERFEGLDSQTTREFVVGLNRVLPETLVSDAELRRLSHPYGLRHFDGWLQKAKKEHPGPTAALLETLARWRERIRSAVPTIAGAG
jgi:hypothetical protein